MKRRVVLAAMAALSWAAAALGGDIEDLMRQREAARESAKQKLSETPVRKGRDARGDSARIAEASNRFAFDLYARLTAEEGNVFLSPSSIHTALSMTYAGARGRTEKQMAAVLHVPVTEWMIGKPPHPHREEPWPQEKLHSAYAESLKALEPGQEAGYELHQANALWGQQDWPWREEFLKLTRDSYGAGLREVDFAKATEAARQTINAWVEQQTKDKIKELLHEGDVDRLTTLVLTNAIYFKGDWASRFDKELTQQADFHVSAGKTVQAPMMNRTGDFGYAETKDVQILRLPYAGEDLSMIMFLPREVGRLPAIEKSLTADALDKQLKGLGKTKVQVAFPRFRVETRYYLQDPLSAMGMPDAFQPRKADFSGMDGKRELYISKVIHQAFVDVNEEGTEAAAATAVVMKREAAAMPKVFRADRPFLFLIRHEKTGLILFLGRVVNPTL